MVGDCCRDPAVLPQGCVLVAPSAYWRHAAQRRDPELRCARARRDEELISEIERVWQVNLQVYGADKVWRQLNREGIAVARCTVERLMRQQGLRGAMRGKSVKTTRPDPAVPCPLDRVNRQFSATRPNQLWVTGAARLHRAASSDRRERGRAPC